MKILQINSYSNGSTGNIAQAIHKELLLNNEKSIFAYGSGPSIGNTGYQISSKFGIFIHTILYLLTGLHGYFSILSTKRLLRKIDREKPDIVHLHNLHGAYLNVNMLL